MTNILYQNPVRKLRNTRLLQTTHMISAKSQAEKNL